MKQNRFVADIVIVGGGPATLALLCNAAKTNRLNDLVNSGDSIAILEAGLSLGGGALGNFAINSNTSANGFLRCLHKKVYKPGLSAPAASTQNEEDI